jgi:uncharacterized membrane protein
MATTALYLHLLSLLVLAAGGLGGLFVHLLFRDALRAGSPGAAHLGQLGARFGMMATIGALLLLASGTFLLASRGWADVGQTWLSVKLGIFVVLFLNGAFVARPTGDRLGAVLSAGPAAAMGEAHGLVKRLTMFYAVQLTGLAAIIALAVFGPN